MLLELKILDKDENRLIIIDNLVLAKDQSKICDYIIECRKSNVLIVYISQSFLKP